MRKKKRVGGRNACSSTSGLPFEQSAANMLMLFAPVVMLGGAKYIRGRRRRTRLTEASAACDELLIRGMRVLHKAEVVEDERGSREYAEPLFLRASVSTLQEIVVNWRCRH